MATRRERFFECSCTCHGRRRSAHVRAWAADDARAVFLALLADEGLEPSGDVVTIPARIERRVPSIAPPVAPLPHAARS